MGANSKFTELSTEIPVLLHFVCDDLPENQEDLESAIIRDRLVEPDSTIEDITKGLTLVNDWQLIRKNFKSFRTVYKYRPKSEKYDWSSGSHRNNQMVDIKFIDDEYGGVGVKASLDSPNHKQGGKEDNLGFAEGQDPFDITSKGLYKDLYRYAGKKLLDRLDNKNSWQHGTYKTCRAELITKKVDNSEEILLEHNRQYVVPGEHLGDWPDSRIRQIVGYFAKEQLDTTGKKSPIIRDQTWHDMNIQLAGILGPGFRSQVEQAIRHQGATSLGALDKPWHWFSTKGEELFKVPAINDAHWNNLNFEILGHNDYFGSGMVYHCIATLGDSTQGTKFQAHVRCNSGLFTNCVFTIQSIKNKSRIWEALN